MAPNFSNFTTAVFGYSPQRVMCCRTLGEEGSQLSYKQNSPVEMAFLSGLVVLADDKIAGCIMLPEMGFGPECFLFFRGKS